MKIINYEIEKGKFIEVEVSDEMYEAYQKINLETTRNDWKFDWREKKADVSLEKLEEAGVEFASEDPNIEDNLLKAEEIEMLRRAIDLLSDEEKDLIKRYYFLGQKYEIIAKDYGVQHPAIVKRMQRILKKIRKNFAQ